MYIHTYSVHIYKYVHTHVRTYRPSPQNMRTVCTLTRPNRQTYVCLYTHTHTYTNAYKSTIYIYIHIY
uniref:Uncharacterized protein n=1 Tax=Arundo donax TaxID=35708 RepID=A0A0A9HSU0_ARUDO